ncbi:hypothetical protein I4U23_018996 [Adineta vaga]|nr:hypothetical protein I4U23_018996 [Adineta vaga]
MDSSIDCQVVLTKINEFYRITTSDSDEIIKASLQDILQLWPEVIQAGKTATDDELFTLNVSRAVLTQIFAIALSKDFFSKDHSLVREIFFTLFNILIDYMNIFKEKLSTYIDSNIRLILKMATSITSLVRFQDGDLSKSSDQQLLIAMREHIDNDNEYDSLSDGCLSLIWNLSDRTILVPILLKAEYGKSVIEWIEIRQTKFREDKIDAPIHILHNLVRHDDGIKQFNDLNALEVIEHIKFEPSTSDDEIDITLHLGIIRALLTDLDLIKQDSTKYSHKLVNMLLQFSISAIKNERYRHDGFHVSEPLTVLVKLFHNDQILHDILIKNETKPPSTLQSIIELFTSYLSKFYPKIHLDNDILDNYTCVLIFNLFWILSKYEQYRQAIRDCESLMELVKTAANDQQSFVDTFMPHTLKSIQDAVNEILRNLNSIS